MFVLGGGDKHTDAASVEETPSSSTGCTSCTRQDWYLCCSVLEGRKSYIFCFSVHWFICTGGLIDIFFVGALLPSWPHLQDQRSTAEQLSNLDLSKFHPPVVWLTGASVTSKGKRHGLLFELFKASFTQHVTFSFNVGSYKKKFHIVV